MSKEEGKRPMTEAEMKHRQKAEKVHHRVAIHKTATALRPSQAAAKH